MRDETNNPPVSQNASKETSNIIKYFLHGIPLAFVSLIFMYILRFSLAAASYDVILEVIGLLLIIGGTYLVIIGGVNSIATNMLWKIRIKASILSFLGQGCLFTIILFFVNPFLYIIIFTFAATLILEVVLLSFTFVILALVLGYIGRNVASEFVGDRYESDELASVHDRQVVCPHCGAQQLVGPSKIDASGGTRCPKCGDWFQVRNSGPSIS
ncbi:MAG: hypothetical protein R6V83_13115 [Candidatus Thorarchaeota archaeon]